MATDARQTPEDDLAELKRYDIKVYKASVEMVTAMTAELANIGVPFFGMKSNVLKARQENDRSQDPDAAAAIGSESTHDRDLKKLQNRMLELLEDLCKE